MNTKVKICGMTRAEDITNAQELGVDFLGLILVPSSSRCISPDTASALRASIVGAKAIGVIEGIEGAREYAQALKLDYLQVYAPENVKIPPNLGAPVIRAYRGVPDVSILLEALNYHPYILIDKKQGEDKAQFDRIALLPFSVRSRLFLAGGLTPQNIHDAINLVRPFAADCARGVEISPGIKDPVLLSSFLSSIPS